MAGGQGGVTSFINGLKNVCTGNWAVDGVKQHPGSWWAAIQDGGVSNLGFVWEPPVNVTLIGVNDRFDGLKPESLGSALACCSRVR